MATKKKICMEIADVMRTLNVMIYKSSDDEIIHYMKQYGINPNNSIQILDQTADGRVIDTDVQCPLIYICCLIDTHDKLLAFLIDSGVDLNPRCELPELLYSCCKKYIPVLYKYGSRLNPENITNACEQYLLGGNIEALMNLRKYNVISSSQLKIMVNDKELPFRILDKLFERIHKLNIASNTQDEFYIDKYNQLISRYIETFSLFIRNGYDVGLMHSNRTYSFVQNVVNTYFDKLIEYVLANCSDGDLNEVSLIHYSNIKAEIRNEMSYVYNDEKYETLKKIFSTYKVPTKIIKRKKVVKKTISTN